MKTHNIISIAILTFFLAISFDASAQVYFKLSQSEDEKTYIVSLVSDVSVESPLNMVSTAQVSLRLPANSNFVVNNLRTELANVNWQESYVAESPDEAPGYEYISFGLTSLGTKSISFELGEEVELFRFDNLGDCPGEVSLINNESDEFLFPNSRSVSISNGITVLGLGTQAYAGNYEQGSVSCASLTQKEVVVEQLEASVSLSPNPTTDILKINYTNALDFNTQKVKVYNLNGVLVHSDNLNRTKGNHNLEVDVRDWNTGSYIAYIENDKGTTKGNRFVKLSAF